MLGRRDPGRGARRRDRCGRAGSADFSQRRRPCPGGRVGPGQGPSTRARTDRGRLHHPRRRQAPTVVAFVPVELAARDSYEGRAAPGCVTSRPTSSPTTCDPKAVSWSSCSTGPSGSSTSAGATDRHGRRRSARPGRSGRGGLHSALANSGAPQNFTADRGRLLAAINRPLAAGAASIRRVGPMHDPRNTTK